MKPVVRCGECRHYDGSFSKAIGCDGGICRGFLGSHRTTSPDDGCTFGERRPVEKKCGNCLWFDAPFASQCPQCSRNKEARVDMWAPRQE